MSGHDEGSFEGPQKLAVAPVTRTDVDGVATFWVEGPPPLRAALLFRVGQQDEELWSAGATHLVEHLALSPLQHPDYQFNGVVTTRDTGFYVAGTADEVVGFLHATIAALARLPLQRLEAERRILSTEAASRGTSLVGSLLAIRYGPTGPGLAGYDEWGLRTLGPLELQAWADRSCTLGNAVLWMSGPPPGGLHLALPPGSRLPLPPLRPAGLELPTALNQPSKVVGCGFVSRRGAAAMVLTHILHRRCHGRLRTELAVSYSVGVDAAKLSATELHVSLFADALPEEAAAVAQGMLDLLDELAGGGISRDDVAQAAQAARRAYEEPGAVIGWVAGLAEAALHGEEPPEPARLLQELTMVTPQGLARQLRQALDTAIFILPSGVAIPPWRFRQFAVWSSHSLTGQQFNPVLASGGPDGDPSLVVGASGVMLMPGPGKKVTIRFEDCAACLAWNNGDRMLYSLDGFRLKVAPAQWIDGWDAVRLIDAQIPRQRMVPMGDPPPPATPAEPPPSRHTVVSRSVTYGPASKVVEQMQAKIPEAILAIGLFESVGTIGRGLGRVPGGVGIAGEMLNRARGARRDPEPQGLPGQVALAVTASSVYVIEVSVIVSAKAKRIVEIWDRRSITTTVETRRLTHLVKIRLTNGRNFEFEAKTSGIFQPNLDAIRALLAS